MKRNALLVLMLFIGSSIAFAQKDRSIKYSKIINTTMLEKHLSVIASAEMEGRETGTEGQRKAAAYIESHFKGLGLTMPPGQNGYQQMYPLYQDSVQQATLAVGADEAVFTKDFIIPRNNHLSSNIKSTGIVFAGYGIEDKNYSDYENLDVKGKFVLMFLGEPKSGDEYLISGTNKSSEWSFRGIPKKLALAKEKAAAAVIFIIPSQITFSERTIRNSTKTSMYFPETGNEDLPEYSIISHEYAKKILGAETEALISKAKKSEPFTAANRWSRTAAIHFNYTKHRETIMASNVLGMVEGTDKKDEYVFLTAHYDHLGTHNGKIYYGADDDGSGTVAVMMLANAFAQAKADGFGPRRSIVFMTVSGEEKGLWGSEYYTDHPIYPLEKTSVDLNIDMVGRIDTERKTADTNNYVYVVGHNKISTELPIINEGANKKYTNLVLDYKFDDPNDRNRIYYRSDHYNFARKGVPVLFFYDGMLKSDYHKPSDTIDKINWPLYEKRVKMIYHTAWEMANSDHLLIRDIPLSQDSR